MDGVVEQNGRDVRWSRTIVVGCAVIGFAVGYSGRPFQFPELVNANEAWRHNLLARALSAVNGPAGHLCIAAVSVFFLMRMGWRNRLSGVPAYLAAAVLGEFVNSAVLRIWAG